MGTDDTIAAYVDTDGSPYCVFCFVNYASEAVIEQASRLAWSEVENRHCTMCGERLDGRHVK